LFEIPDSSLAAKFLTIFILLLILISTVAFVLESIPSLEDNQKIWNFIEAVTSIAFTIEYLLRLYAFTAFSRHVFEFVKSPLNVLDLLAILPYYMELIL